MKKPVTELNNNLKKVMRENGVTQYQLALQTGITQSTICLISLGKREPELETMLKIVKVLPAVKFARLEVYSHLRGELEKALDRSNGKKKSGAVPRYA